MPRKQAYSHMPVKKTGGINEKLSYEDKFISVTTSPLTYSEYEKLTKRMSNLSKVLVRHSFVWNRLVPTQLNILKNYIQYYYEYYEFDQFDSSFETLPSLDVNLYTVSSEQLIYKSFNIFNNPLWPIRFHSKFVAKMLTYSATQIKYVLSFVMLLAQGQFYGKNSLRSKQNKDKNCEFGYCVPISSKCIPHNRFFYLKLFRQKNLLFSVGVQKIPIVRAGVIKRYQYHNYILLCDILSDQIVQNPAKLDENVQRFVVYLKQDVAKKDHNQQLVIQVQKKRKVTADYLFEQFLNPYLNQMQVFATQFHADKKYDYKPFVFKPQYVALGDTTTLVFDKSLKRWVASDYLSKIQQKALNQYQRKVNQDLVKRFVDFQSAKTLVELLTKIPNFKVQLTEQQKDVIGENGNVLVIGRSGTGKTTCAVLRLFAIQMLFKIRLSLSKKKFQTQLKDTRCSADDIDKTMGLHCVFLTASPVLTNQIQRYYKKLTDNIKVQLEKKKKRVQEERRKQEQLSKTMKKKQKVYEQQQKTQQLVMKQEQIKQKGDEQQLEAPQTLQIKKSKQVIEQQQQMNKQLGGIQLNEKIQNEQFEQDEQNYDEMKDQLQQKMKKFKSLFDLKQQDYPGFFTVKSFIMMIDGTLTKPFFIRKQAENTQEQSQATWHNEKKGVMMIENYYRNQQQENKDQDIVEEEIQQQINYSDQQELQHEYLRQIQLRENRDKQKLTDKLKKNKKTLSFQVDYDYFYTYFWPNVRHKHYSARNITPHLVWTQIYSTIKGGASAHLYGGFYLTQKAYINESTNSFLTKQQKLDVYQTFCQYERWKINTGGYDMMDAVNYILNFIRFRGYNGPDVHYVMIDEVQDLPHSIIYLLSKTVRYGVFYSGDTAQTIAKGIGFRFCDLKNLFDPKQFDHSLTLKKPIVKQLTVNFRSHNNILQLANSVVSSIQILFPKTIDRLKKQVSNLSGPKPMILAEGNEQLLFYVLAGDESFKKNLQTEQNNFKKPPLQFGCDQVIIVRDQQSKNKIPSMLQHALCLTIYQAKGLQFNDVILFNFFAESKCVDKWNLLKFLKVAITEVDAKQYESNVTKRVKQQQRKAKKEQQQQGKQVEKQIQQQPQIQDVQVCAQRSKDNKINVKKIISDAKIVMKDINDYAELCSELKMLYTAITRPKNTLIIYDEDSTARKTIQKLWQKLQVIQLVSKQIIEDNNKKNKPQSQQIKIFKSLVNSTNNDEWKKQGMKMYARGYFQQAMKCFKRSANQDLYKKSLANWMADTATKKLIQIQSERSAIKNKLIQYQKMSQSDLSRLKKKLKKQETITFDKFTQAGETFEQLHMYKQAGQCYFSGRKYQNAYNNFSRAKMNKQAAQSLQMLNKYREASQYYDKQGLYLKVIQCLDMINQWELILKYIQKYANQMTDLEKKSLFKKYSALALQQLVYQIEFQNEPEQNKPQNNRVQVIKQQDDSENQDWDSDQDPQVAAEKSLSRKSSDNFVSRKLSNIQDDNKGEGQIMRKMSATDAVRIDQDKIIKQSVYENVQDNKQQNIKQTKKQDNIMQSMRQPQQNGNSKADQSSFADLNSSNENQPQDKPKTQQQPKNVQNIMQSVYDSKPQQQHKQVAHKQQNKQNPNNVSGSFAQLNSQQSSFADLNSIHENQDYNTKYPSQLQPDIQSIKSLADRQDQWLQNALSQIQAKTHTQYSIIDEQQNYNENRKIIKTKGNIIIQDEIMKKIINIVSIVNQSVDQFFKQFKGYQSLITITKDKINQDQNIIDNRPQISQFEQVDHKLINIILDTLQSFKLYKLCLFVCNRYHLPHKAGRYLVSMALKYSTNSQINNTLNPALISPSLNRKAELEKGILASIALHAMFENVSADFLKVKVQQQGKQQAKNSLGSYFIQGLILQGLYKKAVFMVNPQQSLKILANFCDYKIYQQVFKQKLLKKSQQQSLQFLQNIPSSKYQQQYTIIKLNQLLNQHNIIHKLDTISGRFYKQFDLKQIKIKYQSYKLSLKSYTPLLQVLISQDRNKITQNISKQLLKANQYLTSGPNYKIYQLIAFITTVINLQNCYKYLFELKISQFLQLINILRRIRKILRKKHTPKSYEIIQAVLSVYCCRMIDPCKSSKFINDGYSFMHRTSTICNQFVEELKKNKQQTAYFFQQDYNYVIVKTNKLLEIVAKRFDLAYSKFIRWRVDCKIQWVADINKCFLAQNFKEEQSDYLLKALLRQQLKLMYPKDRKIRKQVSNISKKSSKPKFNYKTQGRPQLVIDLNDSQQDNDSQQQRRHNKLQIHNFFVFPDLNDKFSYLSDLSISAFHDKIDHNNNGKMISGRLLYCSGLNDSYKQYIQKRGGNNLYDAIQFRKFNRLDLYADNILSIINQLSYTERHLFCAQILIHLLIQYKCLQNNNSNKFKIDIPRRFLKYFNNLKLLQVIGIKQQVNIQQANKYLTQNNKTCIFTYQNKYSSELNKKQISQLIIQFLQILKNQQSHKCYSIEQLILLYIINMPNNKQIYQILRQFNDNIGYQWTNQFVIKLRGCSNYNQFIQRKQKLLNDTEFMKNCDILHQVRITNIANINKDIEQSQIDYQIKQKILAARAKAAKKIIVWWRTMKKKGRPSDQINIVKQNRIIKMTYGIKYLPIDDRFMLRSSNIRDVLLSFYLRNIVTSSLDFHFILMTLNKIQDLRRQYIKAYSHKPQIMVEVTDKQIDFEEQIVNIEGTVQIWKNDSKWLKDRNIDIKRKKVFEVKWMTKNNMHKIVKKRAGLNKLKKLENKKKFLKKHQL